MSEERIVYGVCDANCRVPVYSREQMLAILQQTIEAGSLQGVDVTKSPVVRLIRESRADQNIAFWVGTEAEYNALSPAPGAALAMARIDASGNVYLCTDDTTFESWQAATLELLQEQQAEAMTAFDKAQTDKYNAFTSAVNTAVENKQDKHKNTTVTLTAAGWTETADGRYTQTISVSGVTADTAVVLVDCNLANTDAEARAAILEAWAGPSACEAAQGAGTITFYSDVLPEADIPLSVGVM